MNRSSSRWFLILSVVLSQFAFQSGAWAISFPMPSSTEASQLFPKSFNGYFDDEYSRPYSFEGIVALSNCSGSIVRFENSKPSDKAIVLTNGHCLKTRNGGYLQPGEVVVNEPTQRQFRVLSNDASEVLGTVTSTRVLYATMTKTDMALYELAETYGEIMDGLKVRPFVFATTPSAPGTPIEILSGYWRRGYECSVDGYVHELHEGDWTFVHSLRYSRPGCEIIGGTSGSPVVQQGTRNVVAVNNTANEGGRDCSVNSPCEVDETGNMKAEEGLGYAQHTYWVYSCLNDAGTSLDLTKAGCELPKPKKSFRRRHKRA